MLGAETWAGARGSKHFEAVNRLCRLGGRGFRRERGGQRGPNSALWPRKGGARARGSLAKFSLGPPGDGGAKRWREGVSKGFEYPLDPGGRGAREKAVSLEEIILLGRRIRNTTQKFQNAVEGTQSFKVFF